MSPGHVMVAVANVCVSLQRTSDTDACSSPPYVNKTRHDHRYTSLRRAPLLCLIVIVNCDFITTACPRYTCL